MIPASEPDDQTADQTASPDVTPDEATDGSAESDGAPTQDEIDRLDPDSPARGVFDPDVEGPEPNEPA